MLDTKWKMLDLGKPNYGISQADMYQMYAYQKKYGAENVTLLYPRTERIPLQGNIEFRSEDGVTVRVEFVDLFDMNHVVDHIAALFSVDSACTFAGK